MKLESYYKSEDEKQYVKNLIDNDVYCLGNELQELYAEKNEYWHENVANLVAPIETCKTEYFEYVKENLSESLDDLKEALREWYENDGCDEYGPYDNYYNDYIEHLREDAEIQDIMQWLIVSDYLARKLIEIGEPVLETDSHYIWGRTCCGQSIELDGTFQKIYQGLENE